MFILYTYITIFTLYFIVLACASLKQTKKVRDKYTARDANLCVIVYATGEAKTLDNLIQQLKNQDYPKEHYKIYAVLDRCDNLDDATLQSDLEVNYVTINNLEPIGKSQAYSILAEKLSEAKNLDAYIFLDAKNYVDSDFLANANYYLTKYNVFMPMVNYISESKDFSFIQNIKAAYSRYCSKFLLKSRTKLGLTNLINTDAFVIKRDLLNKIESFEFQDKTAEVLYTIKLAFLNIKVAYVDELKVYTSIENYDYRVPSLSRRLGIFSENAFHAPNFVNQEYVYSLAQPNWLVVLLIYYFLVWYSIQFPISYISFSNVIISFIVLLLAFSVSLITAKMNAKEVLFLFAYPIYSIAHIIHNFPLFRIVRNIIKKVNHKHNVEKMVTNVYVTDGKNDFQCQLELISDDGMSKVKFINKNKTYTTKNSYFRMIDAIRELSNKLKEYGLSLKVCQNCKYFQPIIDGSTNMVKGCCNCQFKGRVDGDIIPTLAWNTCPNFEEQNVIELF